MDSAGSRAQLANGACYCIQLNQRTGHVNSHELNSFHGEADGNEDAAESDGS
jgi:hypothetical protein